MRNENFKGVLYFIDPKVSKIRTEVSSCPEIFSITLRFNYVASSPGSPLPHYFFLFKTVLLFVFVFAVFYFKNRCR